MKQDRKQQDSRTRRDVASTSKARKQTCTTCHILHLFGHLVEQSINLFLADFELSLTLCEIMFWLVCSYLTTVYQMQKLFSVECDKTMIMYSEMERDDCGIFQDCLVQRPLSKPLQMLVSVK